MQLLGKIPAWAQKGSGYGGTIQRKTGKSVVCFSDERSWESETDGL